MIDMAEIKDKVAEIIAIKYKYDFYFDSTELCTFECKLYILSSNISTILEQENNSSLISSGIE